MGKCKDCRHWDEDQQTYSWGICIRGISHMCGLRFGTICGINRIKDKDTTPAEFGCTYFKEREKEIHEHVRLGDHWFCIYLSEDEDRHTIRFVDNCDRELGRIENVRFPCDCCS